MAQELAAVNKKLCAVASADQDPARGGDLLRLLKPSSLSHPKRAEMVTHAYTYRGNQQVIVDSKTTLGRPLPSGIRLAIEGSECDVTMGLFPEINRAWVIVDNTVFLWNYEQPDNAYETYTTLNDQLIVAVGICKPKAGFQSISTSPTNASPDFLLVVATLIDVTLLRLDRRLAGQLTITETNITASTETILMRHIQGAADGRIFMAGDDGSVHELFYETKRNFLHSLGIKRQCFTLDRSRSGVSSALVWFIPPAVQKLYSSFVPADPLVRLEIDDGRKLLYALSKKGTISLFNISRTEELGFICSFDTHNLEKSLDLRDVSLVGVKDVDLKTFDVCSMEVIPSLISSVHLVVVGRSGVRIFFTTCESVWAASSSSQAHSRAYGKRLNPIYIRAPPERKKLSDARTGLDLSRGPIPASLAPNQREVLRSFSAGDVTLLAQDQPDASSPTSDLICLSLDLSSIDPAKWALDFFREQVDVIDGNADLRKWGRVLSIRELASPASKQRQYWMNAVVRAEDASPLSEMVLQYAPPPEKRRFLLLTSKGICFLEKNRPIDVLRGLLEQPRAVAEEAVPAFFRRFGLDEACAMALAVACQSPFVPDESLFVQNWAQAEMSFKASSFFSSLGFVLPKLSSSESTFKLPGFKSERDQARRASSTAAFSAAPGLTTSGRSGPSSTSSGPRAVLAIAAGPSARDAANKTLEEVESDVMFSGCFEGLCLYASRLLRPFWQWTIIDDKAEFRYSANELERIRTPLAQLVGFMERHHPFQEAVVNKEKIRMKLATSVSFTPELVETIRVGEMHTLLKRACAALSFFIEIQKGDRRFALNYKQVFSNAPAELETVQKLSWEKFVTTDDGPKLSRILLRALLEKEPTLKDGDFIRRMSNECGDFVSGNYWIHMSAVEEFQKAEQSILNAQWRGEHIAKAVKLVSGTFNSNLSSERAQEEALERLKESCDRCIDLSEHWRAVELCAILARSYCESVRIDPAIIPKGRCVLDSGFTDEGAKFRKECYGRAFEVLISAQMAVAGGAQGMFKRGLEVVFRDTSDAMFHFFVLASLLMKNLVSQLIENAPATSTVEAFLRDGENNSYQREQHKNAHLVLYARWLAAHDRLPEASKVLTDLARMDDADPTRNPTLEKRQEYVNDAVLYSSASGDQGQGLREFAQLLRSAVGIRQALEEDVHPHPDLIEELQYRVAGQSRLWEIAVNNKLWEESLGLVQAFGANQDVSEAVNQIYGAVFAELLNDDPDTRAIARRVILYAKKFGRDPRVFPLADLVENLEGAVGPEKGNWLLDALREAAREEAVSYVGLFVAYSRYLFSLDDADPDSKIDAVQKVLEIVKGWASDPAGRADLAKYARTVIPREEDLGCVLAVLNNCEGQVWNNRTLVEQIQSVRANVENLTSGPSTALMLTNNGHSETRNGGALARGMTMTRW